MTSQIGQGAGAGAVRAMLRAILPPVVPGVLLLAGWIAAVDSGSVSPFFLPHPADLAREFVSALRDGGLLDATGTTLYESFCGTALGLVVAVPLGYLLARSRLAARALQPYLAATQAVPAVALAPLLALWLGYGVEPVIVLCALMVFFPILVNTTLGVRTVDREVMAAALVDGVGRWGMMRYIEFPLALPSVLAGIRTGLTLSVTGAVVGEFVMGGDGLGELLAVQRNGSDTVGMFSTLLMLSLLAVGLFAAMRLIETRLER
ncbi:ABC transporter permease [Kitasatospora acidiphila]|uniref:ABC transporter permease n=1 Tax=Kitasatospora acidiphila TaxID=2567942 RepID=A0A540W184_9ACTN|nr:ABC transporter permease [Kitasatospora acidiphila]TQF02776.1 ABC transporter permease [Kitasatospora acidiphila]